MFKYMSRDWVRILTAISRTTALLVVVTLAGCGPVATVIAPVPSVIPSSSATPVAATQATDDVTPNTVPEQARFSDQQLFRVWYESEIEPPPVNELHVWVLHIVTAAGEPVEQASVTVTGDMPEHGHGLPTQPRVTEYLGQGRYKIEGMKFSMSGYWVITFDITAGDQHDTATIELTLE